MLVQADEAVCDDDNPLLFSLINNIFKNFED